MSEIQPLAATTCFRLRVAPMGFDSAAPWNNAAASHGPKADDAPFVPDAIAIPTRRRARTRWLGLIVFGLLVTYAGLAWTASLTKGQSFDEGLQLAVGYNLWLNQDFRMEGANGDFVKRWATLPYLLTRPHFVGHSDRFWKGGGAYEIAHRFFFQMGNRPEWLLQQGRAMVVLLGVATGLLVFYWARSLFGGEGAVISLGLFAFSPHMLAFGAMVSTDMSITLLLFVSTWCVWRLLHAVTWPRLLASLAVFGLLVLAKPSALVILPVAALLTGIKLLAGPPLDWRLGRRPRVIARRSVQAAVFGGAVVLHAFAGFGAIWAHYSFRYAASPEAGNPELALPTLQYRDGTTATLGKTLAWIRSHRLLPQGFHRGVDQLAANDDETVSFLNGQWAVGGRPAFFPYAIWAKSPPMLLVLLVAGAVAAWRLRRQGDAPPAEDSERPRSRWYAAAPLFALIGCYLAFAVMDDLNIGHRHVLPIYPCLYVLAGATGLALRPLARWARLGLIGAALAWPLAESVAVHPDYLAYFGPQAGGPDAGYRHLVDSSLDWGMDLPALDAWLDEHDSKRQTPFFLAYFGTDSPRYHGIRGRLLPGFFDRRPIEAYSLQPGYYAISATLLQSLYTPTIGPWSKSYETLYQRTLQTIRQLEQALARPLPPGKLEQLRRDANLGKHIEAYDALRFARLCAWLRHHRPPDGHVGHSILLWKLSFADLRAATLDPPAELTDTPLPARRYGRHTAVWRIDEKTGAWRRAYASSTTK